MAFKMKGTTLKGPYQQRTISTVSDSLNTAYEGKADKLFENYKAKVDSLNQAHGGEFNKLTNQIQQNTSPKEFNKQVEEYNKKNSPAKLRKPKPKPKPSRKPQTIGDHKKILRDKEVLPGHRPKGSAMKQAKPDYIDIDGDGNKTESMKKAAASAGKAAVKGAKKVAAKKKKSPMKVAPLVAAGAKLVGKAVASKVAGKVADKATGGDSPAQMKKSPAKMKKSSMKMKKSPAKMGHKK